MSTKASEKSDASWIPGLAEFLTHEESVEAILLDAENKKISVATLGPVHLKALERRLHLTLEQIEQEIASGRVQTYTRDMKRIHVHPSTGKTLLEKPSCYTAPSLWTWRDIQWREPSDTPEKTHEEDWRFLALLAGICGIAGLGGFIVESFTSLPHWVSLFLYITSMIAGGWEAATDVYGEIPQGKLDIHFLMLAVAVGATFIGAWREGALLLFLFSFSGALEHFALHKTRSAINSLFEVSPKQATLIDEQGGEQTIPIDDVQVGQTILVKPGDLFPVDAEVLEGSTATDESNLTGESTPISKGPGDTVFSGTSNLWGAVKAQVLRPANESALQKIINLIQQAQHLKAKSQRFTDRFGTPYTYIILATTTIMFFVWWLGFGLSPFTNTLTQYSAFYRAMTLLVVASPCALVLSIPSAILAAIARGARSGILFRGGVAIEKIAQIDTVALDKTGTLTTGDLEVEKIESFPQGQEDKVLQIAYSLEKNANHPIARAIIKYGNQQGIKAEKVQSFESLVGHGVQGQLNNALCVLGRRELLALGPLAGWAEKIPPPPKAYSEVWVVYDRLLGRILLKDHIREQSKPVLEKLHSLGIQTIMLTGDHQQTAESIGKELGIEQVRAGLKPEDKVAIIESYNKENKKVAMIGDGVNDAPSLAAAYVSIAMGARGSDAALEQSEVVLMNDRIENFLTSYEISTQARKIIFQNLFISLGTILAMVLSASFGLIPLTVGVLAHEGSTAIVCLNSLRLLVKRKSLT